MGNARRAAFLLALLGGGLALASLDTPSPPRTDRARNRLVPAAVQPFFIGAWVSPPTSTTDPEVWRSFALAGIDVALRPLEDPNDRIRNLSTLDLLDSLDREPRSVGFPRLRGPTLAARDDAVQPDELRRLGWFERVGQVVHAYQDHASLFGYFLADEPAPAMMDSVAQLARAFAELDPEHSAYVNLLPTSENMNSSAQARWRSEATRLIEHGRIRMWSWSAYSQRTWGEDATFLLTQRNAMLVARATGVRPIAILQFTGFLDLDPLPEAQLDYLVAESIAHGARAIAWFTYWTPNPHGPEGPWRGGAVEYDGTPSPRADTMAAVNEKARLLARAFTGPVDAVAHFGAPMPRGQWIPSDRVRGLVSAVGGPITIATDGRHARWLIINRDRVGARTITLRLAPGTKVRDVYDPISTNSREIEGNVVQLELAPGGSALLRF